MNIVTAHETLMIEGLVGDHDRVIETVLSKLFVRGNVVHKAYKHRAGDFADLTDQETRRNYIAEDFFWNHRMAPDTYLELRHVRRDGDRFVHVGADDAEDWYIVMKKVDTSRDLMRVLVEETPHMADLATYARVLRARLAQLTEDRKETLASFFARGTEHVRNEIQGVFSWVYTAVPLLSHDEIVAVEALVGGALEKEAYWQAPIESISVVVDNNPENILFLENGVTFIDVMPPKDSWRVHDRYFALCRTSADVSALVGSSYAESLHDAYAEEDRLPPPMVRMVYEIAAALIQVPYRKMVGREDLSEKYAAFIRARAKDLASLMDE